MAFKFVAFAALVAMANAGLISPAVPAYTTYSAPASAYAHAAPVAYAAPATYAHAAPVAYAAPATYAHPAPLAYATPVAKVLTKSYEPEPYDSHPQYSYSYDVHDSLTGDVKNQQETRNGDAVEGSYSFIEADGSRRVVHYTADDVNGFNARVEKQSAEVKTVAPVAYAAPAYTHAAPLAYKATPVAYSAPLYHH